MLALVVVAHPSTDSYSRALVARADAGLRSAGHEVVVLDLYELGFRTAMTPEEREAYHGDSPILDPMVSEHASLVQRADAIVFVYPTWWSGLPAMLKGWLERVLVPGVGFVFDEHTNKVRPGLGQVRRLVGISTYGSPKWYIRLVNDNGRRIVTRALRMSCGLRVRTSWLGLYAIDTSTAAQRSEFLARVERHLAELR